MKNKTIVTNLILLFTLLVIIDLFVTLNLRSDLFLLIRNLTNHAISVTIVIIGLYFFYRFFIIGKNTEEQHIVDAKKIAQKVFKSEDFITVLNTSLPKGDKDQEYGLDYIPYMLSSIEQRKYQFAKNAINFLAITIILGIIFIGTTISFGYFLLNEEAAGTPKTIAEMKVEVTEIKRLLLLNQNKLEDIDSYKEIGMDAWNKIERIRNNEEELTTFRGILTAADRNNGIGLLDSLDKQVMLLSGVDSKREIWNAFIDIRSDYADFFKEREGVLLLLNGKIADIEKTIQKVDTNLSLPDNRIAELLKRLIVSFVIVSFFIAILRYMANLYKHHHGQLLQAQLDEMAIKKFYVVLKNTKQEGGDVKEILTAFMNSSSNTKGEEDVKGIDGQSAVIKDLLATLLKKL